MNKEEEIKTTEGKENKKADDVYMEKRKAELHRMYLK